MRVRLEKLQKRKLHWSKQKKNSQSNHCCKVSCGFDYQVTKCTDLVRISSKWLQLGLSRWTYYYAYRQEVEKMNPENKKRCQSTLVKQKDLLRLSQRPSKGWGDPLKVLAKLTNHIGSSFDMSDSPTANQKKIDTMNVHYAIAAELRKWGRLTALNEIFSIQVCVIFWRDFFSSLSSVFCKYP